MKPCWSARLLALSLILAPTVASAQFEALRFVELPAVGAWARYESTLRNSSKRVVTFQKISLLARQSVGSEEYYWFQIEQESDDFAARRVPLVTQIALSREDALSRRDFFRKIQQMIVQIGASPAFRVGRGLVALGMQKGLVTGGEQGSGSAVDYAFRDLGSELVRTKAGELNCQHQKGVGKAEVVLNIEDKTHAKVDAVLDLWYSPEIPFGIVKQVTTQSGAGPEIPNMSISLIGEETLELLDWGTGATSAITGPIQDYRPAQAQSFVPAPEASSTP